MKHSCRVINSQFRLIIKSPSIFDSMKHMIQNGIINNAHNGDFINHESNTTGNVGEFANEVGRPVDRINHPSWLVCQNNLFSRSRCLLADNLVIRVFQVNRGNNSLIGFKYKYES